MISLKKAIIFLHELLAGVTGIEELDITEKEADELSDCVEDVSKYYIARLDPKKVAITNLLLCASAIYGTRAKVIINKRNEEKPKQSLEVIQGGKDKPKNSPPQNRRTIDLSQTSPSQLWPEGGTGGGDSL